MPPRRKAQPLVAEIITPATAIEQEEEAIIETVNETVEEEEEVEAEGSNDPAMNDRLAKMAALRQRMSESAKANRKDLISETNAKKGAAKNEAKLLRKKQQLEAMGEKADALLTGEDLERKKAWEYSIEDNEKWDEKMAKKGRRVDVGFTDYDDLARRKYKKDMDSFKPDRSAYNKLRDAAEGNTTGALIASSSSMNTASEDLYRDANSFVYADHKPTEDAIDRVIGSINISLDKRNKRSRVRDDDDEGDVTYINAKNKHFNKKLERYYDAHTKEIQESFERGTAL